MKKILSIILAALCAPNVSAQTYSAYNISLVGQIDPDTLTPQNDNQYSGCWGWYQQSKNKEYAISGARNGTWFIDVTNPATPTVCAFVPGVSKNCTWRELKTYQHYCYIVSDACQPNAFQIVDLQYLPDSVVVIHSDTSKFILGHTVWIDQDKMYVGITNFSGNKGYSPMSVWSLSPDPEDPQLVRRLEQDDKNVSEVHDMYVRNDTVYASIGWQGIRVYKFSDADSSLTQIGSYNNYGSVGSYNHSSFLTADGKHLVFCDEVPGGLPIRMVDVQNMQNIQPTASWHPLPKTTPHNPYLIGNKFAVVSSYQDGLFIYDIADPANPGLTGFFDTYPQGGYNTGNYGDDAYSGNWGAYPWLPSGIIVANDMRNGVFLLDATAAYTIDVTGASETASHSGLSVFPNPATDKITITGVVKGSGITLRNVLGEVLVRVTAHGTSTQVDVAGLPAGAYMLETLDNNGSPATRRLIISGR